MWTWPGSKKSTVSQSRHHRRSPHGLLQALLIRDHSFHMRSLCARAVRLSLAEDIHAVYHSASTQVTNPKASHHPCSRDFCCLSASPLRCSLGRLHNKRGRLDHNCSAWTMHIVDEAQTRIDRMKVTDTQPCRSSYQLPQLEHGDLKITLAKAHDVTRPWRTGAARWSSEDSAPACARTPRPKPA
jgi:hypothetical protein